MMNRAMQRMATILILIWGMSAPDAVRGEERELGLQQAVQRALEENLALSLARLVPEQQALSVDTSKSPYDPILTAETGYSDAKEPGAYSVDISGETQSYNYGLTLSDALFTGTEWAVMVQQTKTDSESSLAIYERYYDSRLSFSVSQALLQGFGRKVNRSATTTAELNLEKAELDLRAAIMDIISSVHMQYWGLYYARQELRVQQSALELAESHLNRTNAMIKAGMLPALSRLEAESGVAMRREAVITAETAAANAADELKMTLNMLNDEQELMLTDEPLPASGGWDFNNALELSLDKRPDVLKLEIDKRIADLQLMVAKNTLLPELDATGAATLSGTQEHYGDSVQDIIDREGYAVSIGLRLFYPFKNRYAEAELRRAELNLQYVELEQERLNQEIRKELRRRVRALDSDRQRIQATNKSLEYAEKKLAAEERKFELGKSSNFAVLQYQDDLTAARSSALKAVIDYNLALAELYRTMGTTIEANNIEIDVKK